MNTKKKSQIYNNVSNLIIVILLLAVGFFTLRLIQKSTTHSENNINNTPAAMVSNFAVSPDNTASPYLQGATVSRGGSRESLLGIDIKDATAPQSIKTASHGNFYNMSVQRLLNWLRNWINSFHLEDPITIIAMQMPIIRSTQVTLPDLSASKKITPIDNEENMSTSEEKKIPDDIKIEMQGIKDDLPPIDIIGKGPQILIYHTHTREAYAQTASESYKSTDYMRTTDQLHNIVKIGSELADQLKSKYAIDVLHDKTDHEPCDTAYPRSLKTVSKHMKEYPSLKLFIDVHRNAYTPGTNTQSNEVVMIQGKKVAKIMFVIGTGKKVAGKIASSAWKENYKLALRISNELNKIKPGLAKPVLIKTGSSYNQQLSPRAILVEVGSTLNTIEQSIQSAHYLADAMSTVIK